jgi:hypothetical protein
MPNQTPAAAASTGPDSLEAARQSWTLWAQAQPDIPRRQRRRAVDAALAFLQQGGSPEQAVAIAKDAARQGYASYYATASLVVGAISVVISLLTGGVSILFAAGTAYAGRQGLKSRTRQWQAIVGLCFGGLSLLIFVVVHLLLR